jgi:hypothetical protein
MPFMNMMLTTPGRVATNACIFGGLVLCILNRREFPTFYRRMGIGWTLLLASVVLNVLYYAWVSYDSSQLDKLGPVGMFAWRWYMFLDVPQLITAAGFGCLVWGVASVGDRNHEASKAKLPAA